MSSNKNKKQGGFTLIEILVVVGIIAILAAIVIVAINPKKHFDDAKAAQREANINTILNAVGQYIIDNKGGLPSEITTTVKEVNESLCNTLVPEYVGAIPTDPDSGSKGAAITDGNCDEIDSSDGTGDFGDVAYTVEKLTNDHVQVCTTLADTDGDGTPETSEQTCVTR